MKTFGNKTYLSRAETKAWSSEIPVGDPFGGVAYGERNDPVTATVAGIGGSLLGGYIQGESAKDAAETQANAQLASARTAAEAARFTPVGVTSRFGGSQFGYDPTGRLSSAGYNLSPEMKAYQDQMMGMLPSGMQQYQQAQGINQPLLQGAQGMMQLGQGYLATSPQAQAQKYMGEQQALLAPGREQQLASVRQGLFNTGRGGLAMGGGGGMQATNPEMAAYMNAIAQQDAQLASQATQGGQQYAEFGAGMMGKGTNTLRDYYTNQTSALQPFQTALGASQGIESMGQGMLDLGAQLGGRQAQAGASQANALMQGAQQAAPYGYAAGSYSPMGTALMSAGGMMQNYRPQQQNPSWYSGSGFSGAGQGTDAWRTGGLPY